MMTTDDAFTYWRNIANEAKAGRLSLDPEIATVYDAAARDLIRTLNEVENQVRGIANIDGLGDFPFADTVARVFSEYLGGSTNSLASTTGDYAKVLDAMREAVNLAVARTVRQDDEHGQALGRIDPS